MMLAQPGRQAHIYALLFLGCAVLFAFYRWQYSPRTDAAAALTDLSSMLRREATQQPKPKANAVHDGATVPDLLSRIQEIANEDGVAIHSVTPSPVAPDQFAIGTEGAFRDMMRLMARLETLQVSISSFDIAPSDHGGVTATIGITRTAKPGAPQSFADYIDATAIYSAVRNPFEIGDPVPLPNAAQELGDISWTYHLTSISLLGAERIATIDGEDYKDGDAFNGMTVMAIGPSGVSLASPKQAIPQLLHFRHNPGSSDAAQ
jgi:hypothetical protein